MLGAQTRRRETGTTKSTRNLCASCAFCGLFLLPSNSFTHSWSAATTRSFGHQRERPDRTAGRHFTGCIASGESAAEPRRNGHVLAAFVRVRDRRRVDARAGLELPKRFTCILVQRNELTRQSTGEQKAAAGRQHAGGARQIGQRDLPFLLAGHRVDRDEVAKDITWLGLRLPRGYAGRG